LVLPKVPEVRPLGTLGRADFSTGFPPVPETRRVAQKGVCVFRNQREGRGK
jgi:hypothetical protein